MNKKIFPITLLLCCMALYFVSCKEETNEVENVATYAGLIQGDEMRVNIAVAYGDKDKSTWMTKYEFSYHETIIQTSGNIDFAYEASKENNEGVMTFSDNKATIILTGDILDPAKTSYLEYEINSDGVQAKYTLYFKDIEQERSAVCDLVKQ